MFLVMTSEKPTRLIRVAMREILKTKLPINSYDGESTCTIKKNLLNEVDDCVIVSADSRLLTFVHKIFSLDNVYILKDDKLVKLKDTTIRELRPAHNLMKLYDAGEFIF